MCEVMLKLYSNSLFVSETTLQNYILINAKFLDTHVCSASLLISAADV